MNLMIFKMFMFPPFQDLTFKFMLSTVTSEKDMMPITPIGGGVYPSKTLAYAPASDTVA